MDTLTWIGILLCLSQSAIFSGLNLAVFSVGRLRLEVESSSDDKGAQRVLQLRRNSNFTLTTILWGNVGVNVILALLANSVLAGVLAFIFSTVIITIFAEIMPQAYFSRHALNMASLLYPVLRFYQILLFPVAKPTAMLLDYWLGPEGIRFFAEKDFKEVIKKHIESEDTDIDDIEGKGALNFLTIDDLTVIQEGEPIDPESVIEVQFINGLPVFPEFDSSPSDPFLQHVQASGKKWVIISDGGGHPQLVLDADGFLRAAIFQGQPVDTYKFCHRPIIVSDMNLPLGEVIQRLKVESEKPEDGVIDKDIILVWGQTVKHIITGADILGRLMRGIVTVTIPESEIKKRLQQANAYEALKTAHVGDHVYDVTKMLSMHPLIGKETRPFEFHPVEEYGCTVCHNGNGRGLTTSKAHGPVYDEDYEPEPLGFVPRFTESDPENDPAFAHVYNNKPSHELLFQTKPHFY